MKKLLKVLKILFGIIAAMVLLLSVLSLKLLINRRILVVNSSIRTRK